MKLRNPQKPSGKTRARFDPYALHDPDLNIYENAASGITHKYQRVVRFAPSDRCNHGCEYCYEAGRVFGKDGKAEPGNPLKKRMADLMEYLSGRQQIYEVTLSGGEPLMLSNRQLESILENLSEIPHLARIRFCTYSVIKTPERVDDGFLAMLRRFQDRFSIRMVLHVMHPQQLDESTKRSVLELLKAGAPSFSQVPLLKGVNIFDDIEKSRSLLREFVRSLNDQRIQPYYFVVKLAVPGTTYFAMPLEKIVEIFRPLLQHDQDLTGMETTFRLMAAAPQTKVFLYPETKFEYDKTRGGYIIFSEGEEIFYPYEDLEKA